MKLHETNTKWEEATLMKFNKSYFGAAVYKNGIAVAGGWSKDGYRSAEFYDFSLNRWSALPPINEDKCYHALLTCNHCLYCLGGYADTPLSSVEMLSDVKGTLQQVEAVQTPRSEFAAVNCMNTIYCDRWFEYAT